MKPNQVFEDLPIFTMLQDLLLTTTPLQTCYECNGQQLTFNILWDQHLSDDLQPECEILATIRTIREEKNCERKWNLKKLCQSWPLQSLKEVFGYDGGCQAHLQIWKWQEVTMNNDHAVQIQQTLKQSFRFLTNL